MAARRHGMSRTPTYNSWLKMRQRCSNTRNDKYARYGGRGITVCARWQSFEAFLADMGERPEGTSLDRIDVNRGYEPTNCRWATDLQQQDNRSNNVRVSVRGEVVSVAEASRRTGLTASRIRRMTLHGKTEVA